MRFLTAQYWYNESLATCLFFAFSRLLLLLTHKKTRILSCRKSDYSQDFFLFSPFLSHFPISISGTRCSNRVPQAGTSKIQTCDWTEPWASVTIEEWKRLVKWNENVRFSLCHAGATLPHFFTSLDLDFSRSPLSSKAPFFTPDKKVYTKLCSVLKGTVDICRDWILD